jgi:hypothetical protein
MWQIVDLCYVCKVKIYGLVKVHRSGLSCLLSLSYWEIEVKKESKEKVIKDFCNR